MSPVKMSWELQEEPHPFLKNVKIRALWSKRDDDGDATCILVRCPVGSEIEEHAHSEQWDLVYVLEGKATMWVEGHGEFQITPGTFVAVPKGRKHRTFNIEEDMLIYSVFSPPTF